MGREHEPDDRLSASGERALGCLTDTGRPVLHARKDRHLTQPALERCTRLLGDRVER